MDTVQSDLNAVKLHLRILEDLQSRRKKILATMLLKSLTLDNKIHLYDEKYLDFLTTQEHKQQEQMQQQKPNPSNIYTGKSLEEVRNLMMENQKTEFDREIISSQFSNKPLDLQKKESLDEAIDLEERTTIKNLRKSRRESVLLSTSEDVNNCVHYNVENLSMLV